MEDLKSFARSAISQLKGLEANRQPLETVWQHILELVDPANAFITKKYSAKKIWREDLYSTVALRSLPKFVAALQATVTPPNEQWHRFIPPTRKLKTDQKCIGYLENLTEDLFEMRYRPAAGFNKAIIKVWQSCAKIGVAAMFVDEAKDGSGSTYQAVNMKDFYPVLYSDGTIKKCFRKLKKEYWELREDLEDKGIDPDKVIPDSIRLRFEDKPNDKLDLVHVVVKMSRQEVRKETVELKTTDGEVVKIKRKYKSYLILNEGEPVVLETGFAFTCPYMFTRYRELDNDIYSDSPSIQGSSDIQMLQRMRKSVLEAAERAVDPTILAKNDADLAGISPVPGATIVGGLSEDGTPNLKVLDVSGSVKLGTELEDLISKGIEDFYLVPLYMMYYGKGDMTATEINQRAMERAMMMSINVFPFENELLSPMAARELDIQRRIGKMPPNMPRELRAYLDRDEPFYLIQYEGEQHKAQEIIKANGLSSTLQAVTVLSQFDPAIARTPKTYKCLQTLARANGAPADHFIDEDEYEKEQQQILQQQQAAQAAAAKAVELKTAETAGNMSDKYSNQLNAMSY